MTLREMRLRAGLTLKDAAKQLRVGHDILSHWENGRNKPRCSNMHKLAELYGVTVNDIYDAIICTQLRTQPQIEGR